MLSDELGNLGKPFGLLYLTGKPRVDLWWLDDRWWTFDPRNNRRLKGRVVIGRGRDASDVAMATTFGAPVLESMVVIAEESTG